MIWYCNNSPDLSNYSCYYFLSICIILDFVESGYHVKVKLLMSSSTRSQHKINPGALF